MHWFKNVLEVQRCWKLEITLWNASGDCTWVQYSSTLLSFRWRYTDILEADRRNNIPVTQCPPATGQSIAHTWAVSEHGAWSSWQSFPGQSALQTGHWPLPRVPGHRQRRHYCWHDPQPQTTVYLSAGTLEDFLNKHNKHNYYLYPHTINH